MFGIRNSWHMQRVGRLYKEQIWKQVTGIAAQCASKFTTDADIYIYYIYIYIYIYRVSQEERTKLRKSVPYVKLYRYNPKHLYPKLNSYGDNGQRKCGHLAFPRTVRLQLCSTLTVREQCGKHFCNGTSSSQHAKIAFQYCRYIQCLVTLRTTLTRVREFL